MTNEGKDASSVEKEGQKVTGGAEQKGEQTDAASQAPGGEEYIPKEGDKKGKMTGYNELPEQTKVGGEEGPEAGD
jgi:hypothetical protein